MNLHTNHRLLVALASLVFLALTLLTAIGPALDIQDTPPIPGTPARTELAERGRELYLAEGCGFCHTQFLRDLPMDRPYGRPSLANDYALEDPPLLGTQRTGPDLADVGRRQPSDVWQLLHLYNPRSVVPRSVMPGYPWYFEVKASAETDEVTVPVPPYLVPEPGGVVVARPEALALVEYLLSLRQVEVGL